MADGWPSCTAASGICISFAGIRRETSFMRISHLAIAAMLAAGVPGAALAQTAAASAPATSTPDLVGTTASHWTAAGFVGSNFSTQTANGSDFGSSLNFGGQLAYLWRGVAGGEFLADFAPGLQINNPLLANDSHVYTYMANAIGALPLGADGQFEPYVSGGLGGVQLKTDVRFSPSTTATGNEMKMG